MYCINCGSKIPSNANFCPKCGAATQIATINGPTSNLISRQAEASPASSQSENEYDDTTLHNAVSQTAKRAHRIPTIILIALVMSLTAGIAYATYRIYTEIAQTQPEQQQTEQQVKSTDAVDKEETTVPQDINAISSNSWWVTVSSENTYHHIHDGVVDIYFSENQNGLFVPYPHDPDYTHPIAIEHLDEAPGSFSWGPGYLVSYVGGSNDGSDSLYYLPDNNATVMWHIWQDKSGQWSYSGGGSISFADCPPELS